MICYKVVLIKQQKNGEHFEASLHKDRCPEGNIRLMWRMINFPCRKINILQMKINQNIIY